MFGFIVVNVYGSTELSLAGIASSDVMEIYGTNSCEIADGTIMEALDEDNNPVPNGTPGRLYLRNSMQLEGYTDPAINLKKIRGLTPIGDYGTIHDGGIVTIHGRVDDMIIVGGENVHPQSVASCLQNMEGVREVYALGVDDPDALQGIAVGIVRDETPEGEQLTANSVQDYVAGRLAEHSVPGDVYFVSSLPKNGMGKVIRSEIYSMLNRQSGN